MLDSELKIVRFSMVRVVTFSEGDTEPKMIRSTFIGVMARVSRDDVLIGANRRAHLPGSSPNGELVGVVAQVWFRSALSGGW